MKILIGEDDVLIAEHLSIILTGLNYEVVAMAHNKQDIIASIVKTMPDLALLDIRMKGKFDGIEIGEFIMQNYNFPIIYITAHSDTEIVEKALTTKPSGYLKKPFNSMDIKIAINIALENFSKQAQSKVLLIKDGYKTIKIPYNKILFIKSDKIYSEIYTENKTYTERISLINIQNKINSDFFVQIHRSYIVNVEHINELNSNQLIIGKYCLPISRKYRDTINNVFFNK